jgi:ribose transport system permease protein
MTAFAATVKRQIDQYFIVLALVALICLFGLLSDSFFSLAGLTTILNQLPALIVITVGLTFVMVVGGIDLSVGSLLALSAGIIGVLVTAHGVSLIVATLVAIAACVACGGLSGWLTARMGLPSFIVTLGMLEATRGGAYLVSDSQTVYIGPGIQSLSLPIDGIGVSPALIIAIALIVVGHVVLTRTVAGRYLIAMGTSESAARVSGIRTRPYRIAVFALSGGLAGLAGLFNASYLAAADPNAGTGMELAAIAAAVIGGTSLLGGRGSMIGALIGVLIIAVLQSGLAQLGVSEPMKRLITGAVIILAVLADHWRTGFAGNRS